ncbi:hypothetical protein FNY88_10940 [Corynebacterium guaraldiae]|uniref:DUF6900 domain-containing protein n=1 Tax=Corynebacterium guaraldiae TaxID=3051103 RepID=A0ABY3CRQ7_9CORY|nr:hypothetical protein [Corynebacterium guaraldiae]TRX47090.1 hypothetical protein FNY88_10940 [Corynebacterium guaraldiae]TRX53621.1 hypothetical protein FNY91_04110 [Corynebacterium guaraldiae]
MTTTISREALNQITTERFEHITTLEARRSDDLDFHEVSVWGLKEILTAAYEKGLSDGNNGIHTSTD